MKLAVMNRDPRVDQWIHLLPEDSPHSVDVVYGAMSGNEPTQTIHRERTEWESLLHATDVDAVVMGHDAPTDLLHEQLTRLAQAGLPMLLSHPIAGILECFSLQMIQRETGGLIYPLVEACDEDAVALIRQWCADPERCPVGVIEQIAIERPMADRNRKFAEPQFAADAYLMRRMLGSFRQLNAVGVEPTQSDWSRLRVQLVSRTGVPVSWVMTASPTPDTPQLTLMGDQGTLPMRMQSYPDHWTLASGEPLEFDSPSPPHPFDLAATQLNDGFSVWDDACRGLELADTIEYSARRGKTVEMHEPEVTEAGTFRGVMAASGCFILLGTLAATLLLAAIESIWSIGGAFRYAPWLLLATAMIVFLGLQLLNLALPKEKSD
ncbi:MAG: hypothetical protein AAGF97_05630 [Planctomycetota bacterium]